MRLSLLFFLYCANHSRSNKNETAVSYVPLSCSILNAADCTPFMLNKTLPRHKKVSCRVGTNRRLLCLAMQDIRLISVLFFERASSTAARVVCVARTWYIKHDMKFCGIFSAGKGCAPNLYRAATTNTHRSNLFLKSKKHHQDLSTKVHHDAPPSS